MRPLGNRRWKGMERLIAPFHDGLRSVEAHAVTGLSTYPMAGTETEAPLVELKDLHARLDLWDIRKSSIFLLADRILEYLLSLCRRQSIPCNILSEKEWVSLLAALRPHGILPLLSYWISQAPPQLRPPGRILPQIKSESLTNQLSFLLMERQLKKILDVFGREGIRPLVIKGLALGYGAYPNPSLRASGVDIDLLVMPEQFILAREVLLNEGYQTSEYRFEILRNLQCEESLFPPSDSTNHSWPVELHWHLHVDCGGGREGSIEELFDRKITIQTPKLTFDTLHPVDALIHSSLHLVLNHYHDLRLIWLYDISRLAGRLVAPNEWTSLQTLSTRWNARLAVEHALQTAEFWWGLELPEGFANFSNWPVPSRSERVALSNARIKTGKPYVMLKLFSMSTSSPIKRLKLFLSLLIPPSDYLKRVYPLGKPWMSFLSYLLYWRSWFRKLKKYRGDDPH